MAVTVVVETGTVVSGANSYISLANAELFFERYAYKAEWTAATTAAKNAALVQAANILDRQFVWEGSRVAPDSQPMQWPRENVREPDRLLPSNIVPIEVREANCLVALSILANDAFMVRDPGAGGADQIAGINLGSGALQIDYQPQSSEGSSSLRHKSVVNAEVQALLEPFGTFRMGATVIKLNRG
jgi:hypothetical protein